MRPKKQVAACGMNGVSRSSIHQCMEPNGLSPSAVNSTVHIYSKNDFIYKTSSDHGQEKSSAFDILLHSKWKAAKNAGLFNYEVDGVQTKIIPGKYKLVAQLNANRSKMRRKPEEMLSVTQPCDPAKFNFTKINSREILAELYYGRKTDRDCDLDGNKQYGSQVQGSLVINTAPICFSHSLIVPFLGELRPQVVDSEGLTLAIHVALLAHTPDFRVALNSLAGFASVNHLHFHLYYLPYKLYIETAECVKLAGPCYVFKDHHSPGFVFQLENQNVEYLVRCVMAVIQIFLKEEIAHNIFITRGMGVEGTSPPGSYDALRLVLWARKPSYGMKDVSVFAAAVCELAGHVPVYSDDRWVGLSEEDIIPILNDACLEPFTYMVPKVIKLFSES